MHRAVDTLLKDRVVPPLLNHGKEITVALSGGVDSATSAWLLKQSGFAVRGVFLRSWGTGEETEECSYRDDRLAARQVADCLKLDDFQEIDLRPEYWNEVFIPHLLDAYRSGLTPNPDLACNRYIKFGALLRYAARWSNLLATGHYARCHDGQLFRAVDRSKDQTYFLASVTPDALRRLWFPLGHWTKNEVRSLARALGLPNANRASSRGICFVGPRRSIACLLDEFLPASTPWKAIDIDTGRLLGTLSPYLTLGQRARLGGRSHAYYVCEKDPQAGVIYVCAGRAHPALYCWGYELDTFDLWKTWIDRQRRPLTDDWIQGDFLFQAWHRHIPSPCLVRACTHAASPNSGDVARMPAESRQQDMQCIQVFPAASEPSAPVTAPGQAVVLYRDDLCVGGGTIRRLLRDPKDLPAWPVNRCT